MPRMPACSGFAGLGQTLLPVCFTGDNPRTRKFLVLENQDSGLNLSGVLNFIILRTTGWGLFGWLFVITTTGRGVLRCVISGKIIAPTTG